MAYKMTRNYTKRKEKTISNIYRFLKDMTEKKKKKFGIEKMTANKCLKENDKISRVCVRLFDESTIYIFN